MADDPGRPEPDRLTPEEALPPAPTPDQLEAAEQLLRQANLARMRGRLDDARRLLDEALATAPGSSAVQEAVGDAYIADRQTRKARDAYHTAVRLEPGNASAERKYGETVLAVQLALDPSFATVARDESFASGRAAVIMNFLLPGLGHLTLGRQREGTVLLAVWVASVGLALAVPNGLSGFPALFGRPGPPFNGLVLLPLFTAAAAWLYAIGDSSAAAKRMDLKQIPRPTPPVDKDFEL